MSYGIRNQEAAALKEVKRVVSRFPGIRTRRNRSQRQNPYAEKPASLSVGVYRLPADGLVVGAPGGRTSSSPA
jgi:hypothetical protein